MKYQNSTELLDQLKTLPGLQTGSKIAILFYLGALACSATTVYFTKLFKSSISEKPMKKLFQIVLELLPSS